MFAIDVEAAHWNLCRDKIFDTLLNNNVLPDEQKGCRKKSKGKKDQLLIDKVVLCEAKRKKRCLSVAWIDYKKTYDMVHTHGIWRG